MTNIDKILDDIDALVPPEMLDVVQEVGEVIRPQLELIVALSGMEEVVSRNRGIDTHHLFWRRSDYQTSLQRQFRKVFVVPVNMGVHQELHARIDPPPMPRRGTMLGYLSLLDSKEVMKDRKSKVAL